MSSQTIRSRALWDQQKLLERQQSHSQSTPRVDKGYRLGNLANRATQTYEKIFYLHKAYNSFKRQLLTMMAHNDPLSIIQSTVFEQYQLAMGIISSSDGVMLQNIINKQDSDSSLSDFINKNGGQLSTFNDICRKTCWRHNYSLKRNPGYQQLSIGSENDSLRANKLSSRVLTQIFGKSSRANKGQIVWQIQKTKINLLELLEHPANTNTQRIEQILAQLITEYSQNSGVIGRTAKPSDSELVRLLRQKQLNKKVAEQKEELLNCKDRIEALQQQLRLIQEQAMMQKGSGIDNNYMTLKERVSFQNVRRCTFLELQRGQMELAMRSEGEDKNIRE